MAVCANIIASFLEAEMRILIRTLVAVAFVSPAYAGGDDYDAMNDTEGKGPAYFGFVRDTRGSPVPNAEVVLKPKQGEAVMLKSNVLGLYRSHVTKEVAPAEVEVSCGKTGYKQTAVARRPGQDKDMHIETNCTLQRL
jgi:hypothetical protein